MKALKEHQPSIGDLFIFESMLIKVITRRIQKFYHCKVLYGDGTEHFAGDTLQLHEKTEVSKIEEGRNNNEN
ncbi:hypothetical protein FDJ58_gp092 [Bacillus phage SIOphi]|uniref:Uncharacterized protein n=1 Tax=Bacillus phage SIOphi TaxID=1285382 RepID=R4JMP2_9CAUD|nr:hypothetical protein FDJ58_gp092 [Bacillus phage SIOphi]AGK86900.1 hypothetical protein SIOphi_00460 [Bacillus phage SIOphi]OLF87133.1 hypothetical protein B4089_3603 [Bacillus licheniformis]OLF87266.1 hypothetical protein B4089_3736 [Bacillus licheniformis]